MTTINITDNKINGEEIYDIMDDLEKLPPDLQEQIKSELFPKKGGGPFTSIATGTTVAVSCTTLMFLALSAVNKMAGGTGFDDFYDAFFNSACNNPAPSEFSKWYHSYSAKDLRQNPFCQKVSGTYINVLSRAMTYGITSNIFTPVQLHSDFEQGRIFVSFARWFLGTCATAGFATAAYAMAAGPVGGKRKSRKSKKSKKSRKQNK